MFIAKCCPHANRCIGRHVRTKNAHLKVVEAHTFHAREERQKRLTESGIKSVHRTVTFAHLVANLVAHLEFDRSLRHRNTLRRLVFNHAVVEHLERFLDHSQVAVDQELEARFGGVEMPARIFAFLDFLEEACHHRILLVDARLNRLELFDNERTTGLVACHEHAVVTHRMRVDMFKTAADLHDAIDVRTTLMSKCGIAHVRGMHVARQVHNLVDIATQLAQVRELLCSRKIAVHLELQIGCNRREVCVTAAFAVAIHHALHHHTARLHSVNRVCHGKSTVIMHVDAKRRRNSSLNLLYDFFDFPRHRSAVRIAKHDAIGMAKFGRLERFERVFRISLIAIEEMFRIVNHLFGMFLEVCDRRLDHVEVFFESRADNVRHMQIPALAENRLDRSFGLDERLQKRVILGQNTRTARRAKCGNFCMLELNVLDELEKFLIGRIAGVRPTAFNIVKSKVVQNSSDLDFIS